MDCILCGHKLTEKDIRRQKEIQNHFKDYKFIRIKAEEVEGEKFEPN